MSDTPTIEVSAAALELLKLLASASSALPEETRRPLHALFDSAIALRRRGVLTTDDFDRIHDIVAAKLDGAPIPFPRVGDSIPPQPSPLRAIQQPSSASNDEILDAVPLDGNPHGPDVLEAISLEDLPHQATPASDEILDAVDVRADLNDSDVLDAPEVESLEQERTNLTGVDGKEVLKGEREEPIPGLADVPDSNEEEGGALRGLAGSFEE